ncbi:MAG: HAD-IA family hydrolase [Gammaproteobacteria bacterium]|nr:HAD-IA family hydrolase [Gammaproteobacteria bacterium]
MRDMTGEIKVLTFDVGGSVFDWQSSTQAAVKELADERRVELDVPAFCFQWRRRMFETLAEVRKGDLSWRNADQIHLEVLDELGEQHDELELTSDDKQRLNSAWHRMDVWEDVPAALIRLRERYVVSILTVLSLSIVVDSSKHAGIDWDAYLSCEFLGVYKPEAEAYRKAARLFGVKPSQTMMVACHPPDLAAAQRAGLKAAHVKPKVWEMGSEGDSSAFEIQAESYTDLADQLCG